MQIGAAGSVRHLRFAKIERFISLFYIKSKNKFYFLEEILMAKVSLTTALRNDYELLFNTCRIRDKYAAEVENIVDRINGNKSRYETVSNPLSVPWYVTGIIHSLEASLSFKGHLHNGDPLTARTKNVPANRPAKGSPPFTWEESASDALVYDEMTKWTDWSITGTLYRFEYFNGMGYRTRPTGIFSPYLWSYSQHYAAGKFASDGVYSPTLVSKQCGAAVLLRRMAERGIIHFDAGGNPVQNQEIDKNPLLKYRALVKFSNKTRSDIAEELQKALNQIPGIFLKTDGVPGDNTSAAFKRVTGMYLIGDPRK